MVISRHVGLPCRSDGCKELFAVAGMHGDFQRLTAAADERNDHELQEHGLIYEPRPTETLHVGRRARIGMNLP